MTRKAWITADAFASVRAPRGRELLPRAGTVEVGRLTAALRRSLALLDRLEAEARGACCPACYCGARYGAAELKMLRQAEWLAILGAKLGDRGAEEFARSAREGYV